MKEYRIFLAYRTGQRSQRFAEEFWYFLNEDGDSKQKYGNVYYSILTEQGANYKKDIKEILEKTKYFVIPVTKHFFDGFLNKDTGEPNTNLITYIEIQTVLEINKERKMKMEKNPESSEFLEKIEIVFATLEKCPFLNNVTEVKAVFKDLADDFLCLKSTNVEGLVDTAPGEGRERLENELMRKLAKRMSSEEYIPQSFTQYIRRHYGNIKNNVYLTFKEELEDEKRYPFYRRVSGAKRIKILNFAGTSFIAGIEVADANEVQEPLRQWFETRILNGEIEATVVLTQPGSFADEDASNYKMYPRWPKVDTKKEIIKRNLDTLTAFQKKKKDAKLHLFTTDICLPYGIFIVECEDRDNDYMKIDLYAPVIGEDKYRPSFYLFRKNRETRELYNFFMKNFEDVLKTSKENVDDLKNRRYAEDKPWYISKRVIHQGKIDGTVNPHTVEAFKACIEKNYPIELDILFLKDGTPIVYRDEQVDGGRMLADYTYRELLEMENAGTLSIEGKAFGEICTFEELLERVNGEVPLMIELKSMEYNSENMEKIGLQSRAIVRMLSKYNGEYVITSSNPYILREVKNERPEIICGMIIPNFGGLKDVKEEQLKLRKNNAFLQIVKPDFVSCDISIIPDKDVDKLQKSRLYYSDNDKMPVIAWTIRDASQEQIARVYCDNYIIEGAETYI